MRAAAAAAAVNYCCSGSFAAELHPTTDNDNRTLLRRLFHLHTRHNGPTVLASKTTQTPPVYRLPRLFDYSAQSVSEAVITRLGTPWESPSTGFAVYSSCAS